MHLKFIEQESGGFIAICDFDQPDPFLDEFKANYDPCEHDIVKGIGFTLEEAYDDYVQCYKNIINELDAVWNKHNPESHKKRDNIDNECKLLLKKVILTNKTKDRLLDSPELQEYISNFLKG